MKNMSYRYDKERLLVTQITGQNIVLKVFCGQCFTKGKDSTLQAQNIKNGSNFATGKTSMANLIRKSKMLTTHKCNKS